MAETVLNPLCLVLPRKTYQSWGIDPYSKENVDDVDVDVAAAAVDS